MITFVATVLVEWLSYASLTAFIPSLFNTFVYSDFTSKVTSEQSFKLFLPYLVFEG